MSGTALGALQAAVYAKLTADTGAGGLLSTSAPKIAGVYDDLPEGQAFPYIVIGDAIEAPWSTMGRDGDEGVITLHIWSQARGFREALMVLDRVNELLDGGALDVGGYSHVATMYESSETLRDPDGVTRHVVARYRVLVQEL